MTIREELKRAVIEAIHGLPYEESKKRYLKRGAFLHGDGISWGLVLDNNYNGGVCYAHGNQAEIIFLKSALDVLHIPITIGMVMQALKVKCCNVAYHPLDDYFTVKKSSEEKAFSIDWELDKKTDDDQSDKTIKKLLSVFK